LCHTGSSLVLIAGTPPAPEAEAFDRGPPHKPAPEAPARHVFKATSAGVSTRGELHADRQACRAVEHPLRQLKPTP
jgi:hypothetical protein